jgi:hypothetical protein
MESEPERVSERTAGRPDISIAIHWRYTFPIQPDDTVRTGSERSLPVRDTRATAVKAAPGCVENAKRAVRSAADEGGIESATVKDDSETSPSEKRTEAAASDADTAKRKPARTRALLSDIERVHFQ